MDITTLVRLGPCAWEVAREGSMHVPAVVYGSEALLRAMDDKVREPSVRRSARVTGCRQGRAPP